MKLKNSSLTFKIYRESKLLELEHGIIYSVGYMVGVFVAFIWGYVVASEDAPLQKGEIFMGILFALGSWLSVLAIVIFFISVF